MTNECAAEIAEIIGRKPRAFKEITNTPEAARRFNEEIVAAKASSENGQMVTAYEAHAYAK